MPDSISGRYKAHMPRVRKSDHNATGRMQEVKPATRFIRVDQRSVYHTAAMKPLRCPRCGNPNRLPGVKDERGYCRNIVDCGIRARNLSAESRTTLGLLYPTETAALGGADRPAEPDQPVADEETVEVEDSRMPMATDRPRNDKIIAEWGQGYPQLYLAEKYGVTPSRIYQIVQGHPQYVSGKVRTMLFLQTWTGVTLDSLTLARRLNNNPAHHELIHLLYSLRSQGLASFIETKHGSTSSPKKLLTRIDLTDAGRAWTVASENGAVTVPVNLAPEAEIRNAEPTVAPKPEPEPEPIPVPATVASEPAYPIMARLLKRRTYLSAAANLLERAGEEEAAIGILEKLDKPSPLEAEVIALMEAMPEVKSRVESS